MFRREIGDRCSATYETFERELTPHIADTLEACPDLFRRPDSVKTFIAAVRAFEVQAIRNIFPVDQAERLRIDALTAVKEIGWDDLTRKYVAFAAAFVDSLAMNESPFDAFGKGGLLSARA